MSGFLDGTMDRYLPKVSASGQLVPTTGSVMPKTPIGPWSSRNRTALMDWHSEGFQGNAPEMVTDSGVPIDGFGSLAKSPDVLGKWVQGASLAKDIAGIGLGIYGALEQSKMNKFMKGYYGDMMDMQRTDFSNAAKSANAELDARAERIASAKGMSLAESDAYRKSEMDKWGATTTFG